MEILAELVVAGEELSVAEFGEAAAVEEDAGALAGSPDETAERLVHFGHAGDLIDPAKGGLTAEIGEFGDAGALDGVDLGERGADHHRVGNTTAEQIDALGKAGAEHEEEGVG
jgi:hypothetical protein